MSLPKLLIFASGSAEGGGSGFENLVLASRGGALRAEIVGVVSDHKHGGVRRRADKLKVPFHCLPEEVRWDAGNYQRIAKETEADFFALSGWLKLVTGLDPKTRFNSQTVFNIHPSPLPQFGGQGMHGHRVHEAVLAAFHRGELTHSAVSMHFVTDEYDKGPVFFRCPVKIRENDTPETLAERVNKAEHRDQSLITEMVVGKLITWNGIDPDSLRYPLNYSINHLE